MKNLIYSLFTTACLLAISCDDDDPVTPDPFLTKIEKDGTTFIELIFDDERRLIRLNDFSEGVYSTYTLFEYGPKGIEKSEWYDADTDVLNNKQHFTLDNQGRIISVENYAPESNFTEVVSKSTYTYDASGRLLRKHYIYENNIVYFLEDFMYDANGNLLKSLATYSVEQSGSEYIGAVAEYTPGKKSMYDHLKKLYVLLNTSGAEDHILEMFNATTHHTFYNNDGERTHDYRIDASDQQFDSKGYLTSQVLTEQNLLKKEADVVRKMTYKYSE